MSPLVAAEIARIHVAELQDEATRRRRVSAGRAPGRVKNGDRRRWRGAGSDDRDARH